MRKSIDPMAGTQIGRSHHQTIDAGQKIEANQNPYASPKSVATEEPNGNSTKVSGLLQGLRGKVFAGALVLIATGIGALVKRNHDSNTTVFGSVKYDKYTENLETGHQPTGKVENAATDIRKEIIVELKTLKGSPHR